MSSNIKRLTEVFSSWFVTTTTDSTEIDSLDLNSLEERVLYSAAPIPTDMVDCIDTCEIDDVNNVFDAIEDNFEHMDSLMLEDSDSAAIVDLSALDSATSAASEIIIVDQSVEGYQQLVDDILQTSTAINPTFVYLDSNQSGVDQITEALSQQVAAGNTFDAIHLVSHGSDGSLNLGNETLDSGNISQFNETFDQWKAALNDGADLLIYGCDVAATETGESFVDSLSDALDVDVLASDDVTGHESRGGDWVFEYQVGDVSTDLIFSVDAQADWHGELAATVDPTAFGATSLDVSSDDGSAGSLAVSDDGSSVYVFSRDVGDGNGADIYAVVTDEFGVEKAPVRINDSLGGTQESASIAISHGNAGGDYVVVWTSDHEDPGGETGVYAKTFDFRGRVIVDEFRIDAGGGTNASVDMDNDGNFVVAWEEYAGGELDGGVFAQVFELDGSKLGAKQHVNHLNTVGFQGNPDVSLNNNNEFVVTWDNFDGVNESEIYGRKFSFGFSGATGFVTTDVDEFEIVGTNIVVGTDIDSFIYVSSDVDLADSGVFVVTYTSDFRQGIFDGGFGSGVEAKAYDSDGLELGNFGFVNESSSRDQITPSVVILEDGNADPYDNTVVITWEGNSPILGDTQGVYFRTFELGVTTSIAIDPITLAPGGNDGEHFIATDAVAGDQSNATVAKYDGGTKYKFGFEGIRAGVDGYHVVSGTPVATNAEPVGGNSTNATPILEDAPHTFSLAEFTTNYSDPDGDAFGGIRLKSVPASGQLFLRDAILNPGDLIDADAIANGEFLFLPNEDVAGSDSFEFIVNDNVTESSQSNTFTLNVTPVSDETFSAAGTELVSVTGGETLVNTTLAGDQSEQQVAALANGGYVIVWSNGNDVVFQQYDAANNPSGETIVNSASLQQKSMPDVVALNDGGFVVVWEVEVSAADQDVYARRYDAAGNPNGADFQVSENSDLEQSNIRGAALSDGGFVLTWNTLDAYKDADLAIAARVFSPDGSASDEFRVNDTTGGGQANPEVTGLENNRFVIGWTDRSTNDYDVKARIFDAGDTTSGTEFTLGTDVAQRQSQVQLQQLENGRFAAIWTSAGAVDGSGMGVFAHVYNDDGTSVTGGDIQVNEITNDNQHSPTLAALGDGGFVAIWESSIGDDDQSGIVGRRFSSDGQPLVDSAGNPVGEFIVNSHRYDAQSNPEAVALESGEILITWNAADGDNGNSGFEQGVYADRFTFGISGDEDSYIPLELSAALIDTDTSESITGITISNIPPSAEITDGNVSSGGPVVELIGTTAWDWSNLRIKPPTDSVESFDLQIVIETTDGSAGATTTSQILHVDINPVDDNFTASTLTRTIDEDGSVAISTGDLTSTISDVDSDTLLTHSALGVTLQNQGGVSDVSNSGSVFPELNNALAFDSSGGLHIPEADMAPFGNGGTIELAIRPNNLTDKAIIFDNSQSDKGVILYQDGNSVVLEIFAAETIGGHPVEPTRLVAEGLVQNEFSYVTFGIGEGLSGDPNKFDAQLYLNGKLVDQVVDVETIASNTNWGVSNDTGIGKFVGDSFVDQFQFTRFVGLMGEPSLFDASEAVFETEQRYINALNVPEVVRIAGQSYAAGTTISLPSGALVQINANADLTYDPNGAFDYLTPTVSATDTFQYEVTNAAGQTELVDVAITIDGVNTGPSESANFAVVFNEGVENNVIASGALYYNDPDHPPQDVVYTIQTPPGNGTLLVNGNPVGANDTFTQQQINDNLLRYSHDGTETAGDSFTFTVTDGDITSAESTFNITINLVDDSAVVDLDADDSQGTTGNDFKVTFTESAGAVNLADSDAVIVDEDTPTPNEIYVFLTNPQDPGMESLSASTAGTALTADWDTGTNTLTIWGTGSVQDFEAVIRNVQYNNTSDAPNTFVDRVVEFYVNDGNSTGVAATTTVVVQDVNDAPLTDANTFIGLEDSTINISLTGSDVDGTVQTFSLAGLPANGTLYLDAALTNPVATGVDYAATAEALNLYFVPTPDFSGTTSFGYSATDDAGLADSTPAIISITVDAVNDEEVLTVNKLSVAEESTGNAITILHLLTTDVEQTDAELKYELASIPTHGTLTINGAPGVVGSVFTQQDVDLGNITYDHNGDEFPTDSFDFDVDDGFGSTTQGTLDIDVVLANDAPTAQDRQIFINEDSSHTFELANFGYQDEENDTFAQIEFVIAPGDTDLLQNGQLLLNSNPVAAGDVILASQISNGELEFIPDPDENGLGHATIDFQVNDGNQNQSGTNRITVNVQRVDDDVRVTDDSYSTVEDTGLITTSGINGLLDNDVEVDGDTFSVVEFTNPANGIVNVNPDGSFSYSQDANFTGTDTFTYTVSDNVNGLTNHWGLNGNGIDVIGGIDATINGTTSVTSETGEGIQFDEVDDSVLIQGVSLNANFTISLDFKLDDNTGSGFQYLFSSGDLRNANSLNIYVAEDGEPNSPNTLKTAVYDGNDVTDVASTNALNIDVSSLIGDGQWHKYTLVVEQGIGARVYIDGALQTSAELGADSIAIAEDIHLGTRNDFDSDRFFGGTLDSLQIYDRTLTDNEIGESETNFVTATVDITVTEFNDPPVAHDNIYGVAHGGQYTGDLTSLTYNDFDVEGDQLNVTAIVTQPTKGTVQLNADGVTFTYIHDGVSTGTDVFEYEITDGLNTVTAWAEVHIDECGFIETAEFQVNEDSADHPFSTTQSTFQTSRLGNSNVAANANGDYVVVWASEGADGSVDILMRLFDFSGAPLGEQMQVNETILPGDNFAPSVGMGPNGEFVVTYTKTSDGTFDTFDIYAREFAADGTAIGSEFLVTEDVNSSMADDFSIRRQANPTIAFNDNGDYVIAWDGARDSGASQIRQDIYIRRFLADGTVEDVIVANTAGAGLEQHASVVINNAGDVVVAWDDSTGIHGRVISADGTLGPEIVTPAASNILDIGRPSLAINDAGLVAIAYEIQVSDGTNTHWETRLQVIDPAGPVFDLSPEGNAITAGDQVAADVSFNDDGSLILTWHGPSTTDPANDGNDIFGRKFRVEYDGSGNPYAEALGDQFTISSLPNAQFGASVTALDSENFVVAWTGDDGGTGGIFARQYGNQSGVEISGTVAEQNFVEDNAGNVSLIQDGVFEDAIVKLYRDDGDGVIDAGDRLIRVVETDGSGNFTFSDLKDDTAYWVVVDSKTLQDSGTHNGTYTFEDAWAEQVFGDGGVKIGGLAAGVSDDASSLLTSQHVSAVAIGKADATGVDFGFSFDVVSNDRSGAYTAGGLGDDDAGFADTWHQAGQTGDNDRSVQGSLRQFITNANAIEGANDMHFAPGTASFDTNGTDRWWDIAIDDALPDITDAGTTIDGRAYNTDGTTRLNSNQINLGATEYVGTGADGTSGVNGDDTLIDATEHLSDGVEGVELEIFSNDPGNLKTGLSIAAADVEIGHISVHGFGSANAFASANIFVGSQGDNAYIHDNIIGSGTETLAASATASSAHGIYIVSADNGTIEDNLISFHDFSGIKITGASDLSDEASNWVINDNQISNNGLVSTGQDGIDINYSGQLTVTNNLIFDNSGYGIDSWNSTGQNVIENNKISGNGVGGFESGGVRLFGDNNRVLHNEIVGNQGSGVVVTGEFQQPLGDFFDASTGNLISQNAFQLNSGIAIDHTSPTTDITIFNLGDGISDNDTAIDIGAGNDGFDHPTLNEAYVDTAGLHLFGSFPPAANISFIEIYIAAPGDGDTLNGIAHGEGQIYIGKIDGPFAPSSTGAFHVVLPQGATAWPDDLVKGNQISVIAVEQGTNNTSEFSNAQLLNDIPIAETSDIRLDEDTTHTFSLSEFRFSDIDDMSMEEILITQGPSDGVLLLGGVPIDGSTGGLDFPLTVTKAQLNNNELTYQPNADMHGSSPTSSFDSITFRVHDGDSLSKNLSTLEIFVDPVNDAPVLDNLVTGQLTDVQRNDTNPLGDTVADILAVSGADPITDVDTGAIEGIAITSVDNTNGTWEYSTDNGATWNSFTGAGVADGIVDDTNAVLLDTAAKVRFIPDPAYWGSAGDITFKAWDQTDSAASGTTNVDVSNFDPSGAFSSDSTTATVDVAFNNNAAIIGGLTGDSVVENSVAGTLIGTVAASDPDFDNFTYSLTADASGRFAIDPNTGSISVASGALLNHEVGQSHQIRVQVTDQYLETTEKVFTITVTDINEAPVIDSTVINELTSIARNDFDSVGDTVAELIATGARDLITDEDFSSVEGIAVIGADDTNGQWEYSTDNGATWTSLSSVGVANGTVDETNAVLLDGTANIRFVPDQGYFGPAGELTFKAWDQTDLTPSGSTNVDASYAGENGAFSIGSDSVSLNVNFVNNSPDIGDISNSNVVENSNSGTFVGTVAATDADFDGFTFSLEDNADGRFTIDPTTGGISVAANDLLNFEVDRYHDITVIATDDFGAESRRFFTITVADINEAPVVDNSVASQLTAVDRGDLDPSGDTVGNLLAVANGDLIQDEDLGSIEGIAVTGIDNSNGQWQYSTDSGSNWSSFEINGVSTSAADETNAVLLNETAVVRFVPNQGYFGSAGDITFKAWDQTDSGVSGATNVDASYAGENGAFSIDSDSVSLNVDFNNNAPVIGNLNGSSVDENSANGTFVGTVAATDIDPDNFTFQIVDDASGRFSIDPNTGAITVNDGSLLDHETNDTHQIVVQATDVFGDSSDRTFVISVVDINESPDVSDVTSSLLQGVSVSGDVSAAGTDPDDGDVLTYTVLNQPDYGTIEMNPDGTWTYQHDDTENFVDQVEFRVVDSAGNESTGQILLNITPVASPDGNSDELATSSTESLEISKAVLENDVNVDQDAKINIITQPENGTLQVEPDGTITYVPDVAFDGVDTFEYEVVNSSGRTSQATTVTINVSADVIPNIIPEAVTEVPQIQEEEVEEELVIEVEEEAEEEILGAGPVGSDDDDSTADVISNNSGNSSFFDNLADDTEFEGESQDTGDSQELSQLLRFQYSRLAQDEFRIDNEITNVVLTAGANLEANETLALAANFYQGLDEATGAFLHDFGFEKGSFIAGTSSLLTVGYLVWMIRAGALLSTFMSAMPAWQSFDPLPIIESGTGGKSGDNEDSLEDLVDND